MQTILSMICTRVTDSISEGNNNYAKGCYEARYVRIVFNALSPLYRYTGNIFIPPPHSHTVTPVNRWGDFAQTTEDKFRLWNSGLEKLKKSRKVSSWGHFISFAMLSFFLSFFLSLFVFSFFLFSFSFSVFSE